MLQRKLNRVINRLKYSVNSFMIASPDQLEAIPAAYRGDNKNYSKFIVFGHQRSGSSMLIGSLKKHPQIVAFGELFLTERASFNLPDYDNNSTKIMAIRDKYPVEFLERYVFPSYRDDIGAVGFKLFPEQIDNNHFQAVWEWIEKNNDLKVIYLERQNFLATYVSLEIAHITGRYDIKDPSQRTQTTLKLDPQTCLTEFQTRKAYLDRVKAGIKNNDVMQLTYEELASDTLLCFQKAQEFLGVEVRDLEISKVKQETRTLSQIIENYDELAAYFKGTEWESFFDAQ